MRALKILGGVIAAIVVVAGLLLVIGMPAGFLTSTIADRVERDTGYHLTIGGSTKVGLWPTLNLTMNDVALEGSNDRETGGRLTVGSIQADMTLRSLWSGRPEITELVINRPDIRVPLRRERRTAAANAPSSRPNADAAPKIQRITVTDGTVTFFNARDHVENRIEGIGARASIDADRHLSLNGNAQAGHHPLTFAIKASMPDPSVERQTIPVELSLDAPGLLQAPLSSEAQVRINGTLVMINGLSGKIGDGLFDGWASVDFAGKPLVKVDLNFRRLDIATASQAAPQGAQQPAWSDDAIELIGLNYADAQIRLSAAELNIGSAHFAPVALEASLAGGILKGNVSNLGAYGGQASGTVELDVSPDRPVYAIRCDLNGVRALPLLSAAADFDKLDGRLQARIDVRSTGQSPRAIMSNLAGQRDREFPGRRDPRSQRRADDPTARVGHAVGLATEPGTVHRPVSALGLVPHRQGTGEYDRPQSDRSAGQDDRRGRHRRWRQDARPAGRAEARDDHRRPGTRGRPRRLRHSRRHRRTVGQPTHLS